MAKSQYPIEANTIGEKIRKARMDKGWTLVKVSTMAGISESYLARIEADKQLPNSEVFDKIKKKLGLDDNISKIYFKKKDPKLYNEIIYKLAAEFEEKFAKLNKGSKKPSPEEFLAITAAALKRLPQKD